MGQCERRRNEGRTESGRYVDVAPRPTVLSLCAGAGGLDLGLRIACSARTVAMVERDAYAAAVLVARMGSEDLEQAPVWEAFDHSMSVNKGRG